MKPKDQHARHAKRHSTPILMVCMALAGACAGVVGPSLAEARTITANLKSERAVVGGTAGCTLREAITAMNLRSSVNGCLGGDGNADTIYLLPGTYNVHVASSADTMTISKGFTISGSGADVESASSSGGEATIIAPDGSPLAGDLFLVTSTTPFTITGVKIRDFTGGHVFRVSLSGRLSVTYSSIEHSGDAMGSAGVIWNSGALTMSGVDIYQCYGWLSGGLYNEGSAYVENSSFVGNDGGRAGAIQNAWAGSVANIYNTTFGRNHGATGTAILNKEGASMLLHSCTLRQNRTTFVTGALRNSSGTVKIKNTFIGSNMNGNGGLDTKANCDGTITSLGYNYLGSLEDPCVVASPQPTDTSAGTEGMIEDTTTGPNAAYPFRRGGLTRVYVPRSNSTAVTYIPQSECLATDQRGLTRQDGSYCEIGAANRGLAQLVVGNAASPATEDVGMAAMLGDLGLDVYYHDDDWQAFDPNPGITVGIISTSVSDAVIGTKYRATPMGFVINKVSALDNMAMVATNGYGVFQNVEPIAIQPTSDSFALKVGSTAATKINFSGGGGWGTPAGSATTYVSYTFNGRPAVFRFTPGAAAAGGFTMPGGRISFPGWPTFFTGNGTTSGATPVGKNLFYEAVFWASRNRN